MITDFDDYMIHQAPVPINQPSVTDRNFYDRYWFNGFDTDGKFFFGVGFGRYPHRFIQDGHLSIILEGVQHSFHASGRAPDDPKDSSIGPFRIEIVEPMRVIRLVLEPNDTEVECDLTFYAKSPPHQEPLNEIYDGIRLIMSQLRFCQFGQWEGFFSIKGRRIEVNRATTLGTRDKSWGVRPVGEFEEGAPSKLSTSPGVYFAWAPLQFDEFASVCFIRQEPDGRSVEAAASFVKTYQNPDEIPKGKAIAATEQPMVSARHRVQWKRGTRWPESANFDFESVDGMVHRVELEPIEPLVRFHMMGIGYQHPEWKHAVWHDELEIGYDSWRLEEVDPEDFGTIHVQTLCRAKMGDHVGVGVIETLCYGPHEPSGFQDFFDGAP
jgi:hypothetical protein